ncbi:single-stranded DNA-binding protein [Streptomyces sp. NPDC050315]|uniref:single-stranded DNA-binding protein n=1 Tax=Streptomyces sp. NPDC050315 TaxID=3155039 RepID=UPI00341B50BC
MTDTMVTLTGNAATAVEHRYTKDGAAAARFRMACTPRRFDREQGRWTDGATSFYTVRAWRTLADNLAASVAVGEPLVVRGRLTVREGEHPPERGGGRWFAAEIDAVTIGHDLTRGTAAFRRAARARTETLPQSALPPFGAAQSGPPAAERPGTPDAAHATSGSSTETDDFAGGTQRSGAESGDSMPVIAAHATGIDDSMTASDSPEKVPVS